MTITDLIDKLQNIKETEGDLIVNWSNCNYVNEMTNDSFDWVFSVEDYGNGKELEIRTD